VTATGGQRVDVGSGHVAGVGRDDGEILADAGVGHDRGGIVVRRVCRVAAASSDEDEDEDEDAHGRMAGHQSWDDERRAVVPRKRRIGQTVSIVDQARELQLVVGSSHRIRWPRQNRRADIRH
jgi:hypothetical protein